MIIIQDFTAISPIQKRKLEVRADEEAKIAKQDRRIKERREKRNGKDKKVKTKQEVKCIKMGERKGDQEEKDVMRSRKSRNRGSWISSRNRI
jgi:hypothetical protein